MNILIFDAFSKPEHFLLEIWFYDIDSVNFRSNFPMNSTDELTTGNRNRFRSSFSLFRAQIYRLRFFSLFFFLFNWIGHYSHFYDEKLCHSIEWCSRDQFEHLFISVLSFCFLLHRTQSNSHYFKLYCEHYALCTQTD